MSEHLSFHLANAAGIIASLRSRDGSLAIDAARAELLVMSLKASATAAHQLEQMAGLSDLVTFAKAGEPRPTAEVLDLSEILAREKVSHTATEAGPVAKLYAFPTVPRIPFNGGDAA